MSTESDADLVRFDDAKRPHVLRRKEAKLEALKARFTAIGLGEQSARDKDKQAKKKKRRRKGRNKC